MQAKVSFVVITLKYAMQLYTFTSSERKYLMWS